MPVDSRDGAGTSSTSTSSSTTSDESSDDDLEDVPNPTTRNNPLRFLQGKNNQRVLPRALKEAKNFLQRMGNPGAARIQQHGKTRGRLKRLDVGQAERLYFVVREGQEGVVGPAPSGAPPGRPAGPADGAAGGQLTSPNPGGGSSPAAGAPPARTASPAVFCLEPPLRFSNSLPCTLDFCIRIFVDPADAVSAALEFFKRKSRTPRRKWADAERLRVVLRRALQAVFLQQYEDYRQRCAARADAEAAREQDESREQQFGGFSDVLHFCQEGAGDETGVPADGRRGGGDHGVSGSTTPGLPFRDWFRTFKIRELRFSVSSMSTFAVYELNPRLPVFLKIRARRSDHEDLPPALGWVHFAPFVPVPFAEGEVPVRDPLF